jgi:hypothetical protein
LAEKTYEYNYGRNKNYQRQHVVYRSVCQNQLPPSKDK